MSHRPLAVRQPLAQPMACPCPHIDPATFRAEAAACLMAAWAGFAVAAVGPRDRRCPARDFAWHAPLAVRIARPGARLQHTCPPSRQILIEEPERSKAHSFPTIHGATAHDGRSCRPRQCVVGQHECDPIWTEKPGLTDPQTTFGAMCLINARDAPHSKEASG
jgi:hypothetical protein